MFALLCILSHIAIYLFSRFIVKNQIWKKVLLGCSIALIIVWTVYYEVTKLTSFNILLFLMCIALSYVLYVISLIIVGTKLSSEYIFPIKCFGYKGRIKQSFARESLHNIFSSTYEELLYRWFIQNALYTLTNSAVISICITSLVFFAIHIRKNIAIVQMLDIFIFSVSITLWHHFAGNPLYCIIFHILRNQLVINQKYIAYKNELDKKIKYLTMIKERKNYGF